MQMFLNNYLFIIMFIMGGLVFVSNRKHLLVTLISLEFLVLLSFFMLYNSLNFINNEYYFCVIFLTFSVCEGSLGLAILVTLIRSHGNDYFQIFNILQC